MTNYTRDLSPYGVPHKVSADQDAVPFLRVHNNYSPKATICVDGLAADVVKRDVCGTVVKEGVMRRGRSSGTFLTINTSSGRNRVRTKRNCVGVHPPNAFVRNNLTKIWYKILGHDNIHQLLAAVVIDEEDEPNDAGYTCICSSVHMYVLPQTYMLFHAQTAAKKTADKATAAAGCTYMLNFEHIVPMPSHTHIYVVSCRNSC